jgi:hypothetical protein|tara:strand:+ start:18286 stop:18588 length:303 start_codon:yes stop_codon:yes gene_type:complete
MTKEHKQELREYAERIAKGFSMRPNYSESFHVEDIQIASESMAFVKMKKFPSEKCAAFLFFRVKSDKPWRWFCPTDSHILGMRYFEEFKRRIENENYDKD